MKTSPSKVWGFALATIILGAIVFSAGPTTAGLKKSSQFVKVSAEATKPDSAGKQTLSVTVNINDGCYIYANPVGNKDFESIQTTVKVMAGKKDLDAKVEYPAGKPKETAGINYFIYRDNVTLKVLVDRPADAASLDLAIHLQVCTDDGKCFISSTVKLTVP